VVLLELQLLILNTKIILAVTSQICISQALVTKEGTCLPIRNIALNKSKEAAISRSLALDQAQLLKDQPPLGLFCSPRKAITSTLLALSQVKA
jgi:hypothetical protein